MRRALIGLLIAHAVSGCSTVRLNTGAPTTGEPTINFKSAETRWLLIKNPRFGDVRTEPEYIWVEEDKLPTTMTTLMRGKSAIIAPPEIVAKYGPPPGGSRTSRRQTETGWSRWAPTCKSPWRSVVPIVHPVTGEVLGVLDDSCPPPGKE